MANDITHDALRIPIRGAKFNVRIPFDNQDDAAESFDTEISKDNGAFADCTNELEVVGGGTSCDMGYLTLTAAEMTANSVVLKCSAVSGVQPTLVSFEPANLPALYSGTAEAGSTTMLQLIVSNFPNIDDALIGCILRNNTTGEAREIKTYLGSTRQATFDAMETACAAGHSYDILMQDEAALDFRLAILTGSAADQINAHIPDTLSLANINAQCDTAIADAALATAANLATVAGYLDTEIAAILADTNELQVDWVNGGRLDSLIDAIKAKTDLIPSSPAAVADIPTVAAIWARTIESGVTAENAMKALLACMAGLISTAGANPEVYQNPGGTKNRVTVANDADGNRTTVTFDFS